jgi:hypothetical protein
MLTSMGIAAHAQDGQDNTQLGTWLVTVTPPAPIPGFNVLYTFAAGGALITTSQIDHQLPNTGVLQGSWQRGDEGEIKSTLVAFLYDPTGTAIGTLKLRATYKLVDANNFTGIGQQAICDVNVANCNWLPASAKLMGKRVAIEKPAGP